MKANWDKVIGFEKQWHQKQISVPWVKECHCANQSGRFLTNEYICSLVIFHQKFLDTLYDPLKCWETIVRPVKIRKSSLETFGICQPFWFLWPLILYVNIRQKNHKISRKGALAIAMAFGKFFLTFLFFLEIFDT